MVAEFHGELSGPLLSVSWFITPPFNARTHWALGAPLLCFGTVIVLAVAVSLGKTKKLCGTRIRRDCSLLAERVWFLFRGKKKNVCIYLTINQESFILKKRFCFKCRFVVRSHNSYSTYDLKHKLKRNITC